MNRLELDYTLRIIACVMIACFINWQRSDFALLVLLGYVSVSQTMIWDWIEDVEKKLDIVENELHRVKGFFLFFLYFICNRT